MPVKLDLTKYHQALSYTDPFMYQGSVDNGVNGVEAVHNPERAVGLGSKPDQRRPRHMGVEINGKDVVPIVIPMRRKNLEFKCRRKEIVVAEAGQVGQRPIERLFIENGLHGHYPPGQIFSLPDTDKRSFFVFPSVLSV